MKKRQWQLQHAKNRLSEVVSAAQRDGPQHITVRGRAAVVMISEEQYRKLTEPEESVVEFFLRSPLRGSRLDVKRHPEGDWHW